MTIYCKDDTSGGYLVTESNLDWSVPSFEIQIETCNISRFD